MLPPENPPSPVDATWFVEVDVGMHAHTPADVTWLMEVDGGMHLQMPVDVTWFVAAKGVNADEYVETWLL